MLNGVHREPRPWARINVVMMQLVNSVIERMRVDQSVDKVEVKLSPKRDQEEHRCAVDWMPREAYVRDIVV